MPASLTLLGAVGGNTGGRLFTGDALKPPLQNNKCMHASGVINDD